MTSYERGIVGEECARNFLHCKGFDIVCSNYHSRYGEIDIIAKSDEYIIFTEVKTRKENSFLSPIESITKSKREKIIKTATKYLVENDSPLQPRFDVIEVTPKRDDDNINYINHIEGAFYQEDSYVFF